MYTIFESGKPVEMTYIPCTSKHKKYNQNIDLQVQKVIQTMIIYNPYTTTIYTDLPSPHYYNQHITQLTHYKILLSYLQCSTIFV